MKTKTNNKKHFGPVFWIVASALVALIVVKMVIEVPPVSGSTSGTEIFVTPQTPDRESVEALRKKRELELEKEKSIRQAEVRIRKFERDVEEIIEQYEKRLPLAKADDCFKKAEKGAEELASRKGLCGFKSLMSLTYKMAYDRVKKTSRAEEALGPIVQKKIGDELTRAFKVYCRWSEGLMNDLATEEAALATDLAAQSVAFEKVVVFNAKQVGQAAQALETFQRDIRKQAKESAFTVGELFLEGVMIKTSCQAVRQGLVSLSRSALSVAVKKASTTVAVGGGAALVDGPLPVGDAVGLVVTVGGLTWTAVDIYKVTKSLPADMKKKMNASIANVRSDLEKNARENLANARRTCKKSAERKMAEFRQILKEVK